MERKFAPGLWAVVGGHIEPEEMNNPQTTCVREIEEETGIKKADINNLQLKFIVMRKSAKEIRIQYVYDCDTTQVELVQSNEGMLYWIDEEDVLNRKLSFTTIEIFKKLAMDDVHRVQVGVVNEVEGLPEMSWSPIEDWDAESFD